MKTIRRRKNPPPLYYKELEKLLSKEVIVQSGSDLGYFHIIGKLEKYTDGHGILYKVENSKMIRSWGKWIIAQVKFNLHLIENLNDNNITLKSTKLDKIFHASIDEIALNVMNFKKINGIFINTGLFMDNGLDGPFIKTGNLKFNKTKNIFYTGTKDTKNFVWFKEEAISGTMGVWPSVNLHINF